MRMTCLIQWRGSEDTINMKTKIGARAELGSTAISSILLVLIPKCPVCLAAYSTLFSAIGINASTLLWIRIALSVVLLSSVLWLAFKVIRQRHILPALGLILGTGFVLSSWIVETPNFYKIGAVTFLAITALWASRFRCQISDSDSVRTNG